MANCSYETLKNDARFQQMQEDDEDDDKSWFEMPVFPNINNNNNINGKNLSNNDQINMIRLLSKVNPKAVLTQIDKEIRKKRLIETRRQTVSTYTAVDVVVTDKPIERKTSNWNDEITDEFYCDQCCRQFRNKKNLDAHNKSYHELLVEITPKPSNSVVAQTGFPCKICPKVLKTLNNLKRHMTTVHKNSPARAQTMILPPPVPAPARNSVSVSDKVVAEIYICSVCQKQFHSRMSLSAHKGYHTRLLQKSIPPLFNTTTIQFAHPFNRHRANTLM